MTKQERIDQLEHAIGVVTARGRYPVWMYGDPEYMKVGTLRAAINYYRKDLDTLKKLLERS